MRKYDWIIEVCEDLRTFAQDNKLSHLEGQLDDVLRAAKQDVLLARVRAVHEPIRDCAVLGADIIDAGHQRTSGRSIRAICSS